MKETEQIIDLLGLIPHPEGGYYKETFREIPKLANNQENTKARAHCTAIYFLLTEGQKSHWHRIDATEIWHWYAGSPLALSVCPAQDKIAATEILGNSLQLGHRPQIVVPANYWQSARSLGPWSLAGCTVSPGFEFDSFELAAPDFEPGQDPSAP
jgi:hypothetical protein